MKTRCSVVALALVAGLGGTQMAGAGMPGGQTPGAHAAGAGVGQAPEPVRLAGQPAVAAGFAAFPRLLAPTGAQAQRINKALAEADDRGRSAAMECRASGKEAQADPKDISWTRTVSVAMRGPRYLSVVAADDWFCGGAYPSTDSFALAYDMQTGSPLNWERLLPKALVQSAALDNAGDGTRLGVVRSPALKAMYLRAAKLDADCTQALRETDLSFMLWPDAQRNGVALAPSGLPHVIAACGADVVIPVPELRKLGVAPALLDAIATAYQAGLYGMGDGTPR
ncbi:MAG TPA: hypothetical protein VHO91_24165 [Rhodopila sp.]|nr:hypothetical protein [Rhodopila sp.]